MSSKRTFLETIFLLYIIGKLFGLSCYSISKGRVKYKVSFEVNDFFKFVALIAIYSTLIYLNLRLELNSDENNTRIFNQAQQILITLSLMFLTGGLAGVVLMRQRFWNIANSFNDIDNQMMHLLKIEIDHNSFYRMTIIHLCICYWTLLVVYAIFGYYSFAINGRVGMIAQYISYLIINGTFALMTIQLQVFMYSMYMRFSALNELLESTILPQTQLELPRSLSLRLQANILSIAKITDRLNNLVPLLSLYFSLFTVPSTVGVFSLTVFNFHSLFRALSAKNASLEFHLLVVIYEMIGILFSILSSLTIAISNMNTCALKILSIQILHRSPNFSFGLFSLNWEFAFSFVASVASYLFILIQFQVNLEKNSHVP